MTAREQPVLGVVSHALPPGTSGYHQMLEQLLGPIPEDRVALVGIGRTPWGRRARWSLPVARIPASPTESTLAACAVVGSRWTYPAALRRRFPRVRRVFATLDPTLGVATRWARAADAELWIYAIDLHASHFWGAADRLAWVLARWQHEALTEARRVFGLSHRMARWLEERGARAPVEILPPLTAVGEAAPLPEERSRTFLYSGWVYSANARPLQWLERAVRDVGQGARLRMLTHASRAELARNGLHPDLWSIDRASPEQVAAEVARATVGVIALDPQTKQAETLRVAWPTKMREYLAVGRPVLCVAADDFAAAEIVRRGDFGVVARSEEETRAAVAAFAREPHASLRARGERAHAFARANIDDATIGRRFREELMA